MIKLVVWLLLIAGVCYGCLCLYLFLRQRSLLYFPHPPPASADAEVLWLENADQRIKIWRVGDDSGPALIYFGGNAEDVSGNIPFFKTFDPSCTYYLMNYRGYGGSSGVPTEQSLFADSLALYDLVSNHHDEIIVMGRSLGTGIAVYLASKRAATAVVLVTPYESMTALASSYYPFMPVSPLLKDRYDSDTYAAGIAIPVLTLTAAYDEIIPRRISDNLIASFRPGIAEDIVIDKTGHNDIEQSPQYRLHLKRFLDEHIGTEKNQ